MKKLPTLYHKSKSGAIYSWNVYSKGDTIFSDTGQVDGLRVPSSKVATPKNAGKVNATTAEEQAEKEALAMWQHKVSRKYSESIEDAKTLDFQPMLAKKFEDHKKKVSYPVSVQKKYNGVRGLGVAQDDGSVILSTRGARTWDSVPHINLELSKILKPGQVIDGEIYIKETKENGITFQKLMSLVKRAQPGTEQLEYHCYDLITDDAKPWSERQKDLEQLFANNPNLKHVKLVETHVANSEDAIYDLHSQFVANEFEGAMVRCPEAPYCFNYRTDKLLKVKAMQDAEFKVVSVHAGLGKFDKAAIFDLVTPEGREFKAIPKVDQETKEQMLRDADKYIGKMATVQFFSLSDLNVPIFPVLLGFRDEKDLDVN